MQGSPMVVADIFCTKCKAQVGWSFVRDLQRDMLPNACKEGRYGLVVSSLVRSDGTPVSRSGGRGDGGGDAPTDLMAMMQLLEGMAPQQRAAILAQLFHS